MQVRLAARDLACRRGDRLLLRGLSFSLGPGEALQVLGDNGIGKSSLLRVLGGLLRPFAGTVERSGAAALLDERLALDANLPLAEALGFWSALDRTSRDAMLAPLALEPLARVPVRYLSTGQRKRAMMARLLGQNAPLWLLDEPLSGLDERARAMIAGLIATHCAGGGAAVIASHQPLDLPNLRAIALADYAA